MTSDILQYFTQLQELLEKERIEQFNQYQLVMNEFPMSERRKQGYTWYPVDLKEVEVGVGGKWILSIDRKTDLGENHLFQVGGMVAVFGHKDTEKKEHIKGTITFLVRDFMKIAITLEDLPEWIEEYKIGVDALLDDLTFSEMKNALSKVVGAKDNRLAELRNVLIGKKSPDLILKRDIEVPFEYFKVLNSSQNQAIEACSFAQDVAIIHGPPGTGKTTTLIHLIEYLLKSEKQVLVTAPSNTAVDLLTQKLSEKNIRVVRIGNPARVSENLQELGIEYLLSEHEEAKKIKKLLFWADLFFYK
jgi:superfamily I DNA and/or RNA helicase